VRTHSRIFLACAALLVLASTAASQQAADPVFRAMTDELDRSMKQLTLEGSAPPYFMSLRVQDNEMATIRARYGAVVEKQRNADRYLYVELRVGDPSLDNTGFLASWQDIYNMREDIPEENDYASIRHEIWLAVDQAYKNALETLSRKKAYLQARPTSEAVPDFSEAPSVVEIEEPVTLEKDTGAWESQVRAAGHVLDQYPTLEDWNVTYVATAANRRYVNSEGSRYLKGAVNHQLEVSATTQAEDGQRLTSFLEYTTRDTDAPPSSQKLAADIRAMAEELVAMAAAPTLEEYAGPVLFTDFGATQLVSQLFVDQLTPARKPIAADDWISQNLPDPKLTGRLNRRVFPSFVTVTDEPTKRSWDDERLAGYQIVDDEGVLSEDITLVDQGRLVTLPMSRQPAKKLPRSNGHARVLPNQLTVPSITNLFVKTSEPKTDMVAELRRLTRESGNEFGILITRLEDPQASGSYRQTESNQEPPGLLAAPVVAYKVYEKDGKKEPVRGLAFDDVSIRALRDIVAMGSDPKVTNLMQPIGFADFGYPAAIVTPSILVEEMEFKAGSAQEPLPISKNPMFGE
jgi:TldD protein